MKRIIAIGLCFLLLALGATPVFAAADVTMTLKADKQTLKPGDQVTITLDIKSEKACNSWGMIMRYDSKVFQVVDGACDSTALVHDFNASRGFVALYLIAGELNKQVGTVTLKVRANAPSGVATFTGQTSVKNGSTSLDCDINTLNFQIEGNQTEPTTPQKTEPTVPQQTEPTVPQKTEPTVPQKTEPTVPQKTEPTTPQKTEPTVPQKTEPTTEQATDATQATSDATQVTTDVTQGATVETQEQTKPSEGEDATGSSTGDEIITIGPIEPDDQKGNNILLIAVISVVIVAGMAVGGYFLLKKKK